MNITKKEMEEFKLSPEEEYIELNKVLKIKQVAQTGGHAKVIIEEGIVSVNGEQEFRKRRKLRKGDLIEVEDVKIKIL